MEDTLAVMFGDVTVKLPVGLLPRITDKSVINHNVMLGIPPAALKAEGTEGDVCIEGKAEFFDNYPRFKAVYMSVPGLVNNIIASRPLDYAFNGGEKMNVYLDPSQIQLFNIDGERIIADRPVTGNTSTGTVTDAEGVYTYRFTGKTGSKNKLVAEGESGLKTSATEIPMYILPRGLSIGKDELSKKPKMVLSGVIKNLDEYHKDAIVTAAVPGFDEDMTVIIRNFSGYNTGDKIKMAVNPHAIVLGNYESFAEAVKSPNAQQEGELKYKEYVQARENAKAIESASATTDTVAEPAVEKKPVAAKKAAPAKKPVAKKTSAVKRPTAKKK
ncbi:MAG: hypothetical protein K2L88_00820 [Clostridiales bacterium]|nr:hypothetical protein [Clostridiales bacterium]